MRGITEPTELHKATVTLIHLGYGNLKLVEELQNRFDILGDDNERELLRNLIRIRKDIEAFRAEAPQLCEIAIRDYGFTWKQVVEGLESRGLLASYEIINIAHNAFAKIKAETTSAEAAEKAAAQMGKPIC